MTRSPIFSLEETRGAGARARSTFRVDLSDVEIDRAIEALAAALAAELPAPEQKAQAVRALAKMRNARGTAP
jgi:hypothetical protein